MFNRGHGGAAFCLGSCHIIRKKKKLLSQFRSDVISSLLVQTLDCITRALRIYSSNTHTCSASVLILYKQFNFIHQHHRIVYSVGEESLKQPSGFV